MDNKTVYHDISIFIMTHHRRPASSIQFLTSSIQHPTSMMAKAVAKALKMAKAAAIAKALAMAKASLKMAISKAAKAKVAAVRAAISKVAAVAVAVAKDLMTICLRRKRWQRRFCRDGSDDHLSPKEKIAKDLTIIVQCR